MTKQEVLHKYYGYASFRNGQEAIIDALLAKKDVLAIMPTGAGKSVCYQVPALMLEGITIVVSPLISLMKDQVQALNQAGIHAAYINSSLTERQIEKAQQLAARGQYKIIYVAPERLETYGFLAFAQNARISMVAVDEAHCISQWGQDFRPSYLNIVQFVERLKQRPVIGAFTATATETVAEDIICVLGLDNPLRLTTGFNRENLFFSVETPKSKSAYLQEYLLTHQGESGIIYCATRKNVDKLYEALAKKGLEVTRYHAGLSNEERKENQEDFIYDRKPVMIATNAFGMGIDKSNVRFVLHYNMPQSMENYYQEAGRAGRDGERAECVLMFSQQDIMVNRFLLEQKEQNPAYSAKEAEEIRIRDEQRLRCMTNYCISKDCLRGYILSYFGETHPERCENCGNCRKEFEEIDVTEEARSILQCVAEMRGRYGINVVTGTLCKMNRAKLREYGVSGYQSYGLLEHMTEEQVKQIIRQMISENLLIQTEDKYALLRLTSSGREMLKDSSITLRLKKAKETDQEKERKNGSSEPKRKSDILNSKGLELFDVLRGLRMEIAKEESVPPYIVFSDKTLVELCVRQPFTKAEMLSVSGVGENKFERYGERFIQKIREFTEGEKEKLHFGELPEAVSVKKERKPRQREKIEKQKFFLTAEQAAAFPYRESYWAAELAEELNRLADLNLVKKMSGAQIKRIMEEKGLAFQCFEEGRWQEKISVSGLQQGLFMGTRISRLGNEYEVICYGKKAQEWLVGYFTGQEMA